MTRLYIPTSGPSDWRRLLADPGKHWKRGRSALELAVNWEAARNLPRCIPPTVAALLDRHPKFEGASLLVAMPEHQIILDGGGHASQTDLWALMRGPAGLISVAIEAKAGESFGKTVGEWLAAATPRSGRPARLQQLQRLLGLKNPVAAGIRYQLLHRTAAALLEAERFGASAALMLVQAFTSDSESLEAFAAFGLLLGCQCAADAIVDGPTLNGIGLYLGWVQCRAATEAELAAAV